MANQKKTTTTNSANNATQQKQAGRKGTPMIVERVQKIPMVNFAVSMGFSQYDRLKSSNITVGDVMARAESFAVYVWQKVQPIVDKLQDPIHKVDQLACQTFDLIEDKFGAMNIQQSPLIETFITKYKQVSLPITNSLSNHLHQQQQQQQQQQQAQQAQ